MSVRWLYSTNPLGSGALWMLAEPPPDAVHTLVLPAAAVFAVGERPKWWAPRRRTFVGGARVAVLVCGGWSELYVCGQRLGWVRTGLLRGIG